MQPLAVNRPVSIESVNRALAGDRLLLLVLQDTDADDPDAGRAASAIGTIGAIRQMAKEPAGGIHIIVEGLARAQRRRRSRGPGTSLRAHGHADARDRSSASLEVDAYVRRLQELVDRALSLASGLSQELRGAGRAASTIRCGWPICWRACST